MLIEIQSQEVKETVKVKNEEELQTFMYKAIKDDFSIYEKRIMLFIVLILNQYTYEETLIDGVLITKNKYNDLDIVLPSKYILQGEEDKNHGIKKKALNTIVDICIEYENHRYWALYRMLERVTIHKYDQDISFRISPMIREALLNISKKLRKIEPQLPQIGQI